MHDILHKYLTTKHTQCTERRFCNVYTLEKLNVNSIKAAVKNRPGYCCHGTETHSFALVHVKWQQRCQLVYLHHCLNVLLTQPTASNSSHRELVTLPVYWWN